MWDDIRDAKESPAPSALVVGESVFNDLDCTNNSICEYEISIFNIFEKPPVVKEPTEVQQITVKFNLEKSKKEKEPKNFAKAYMNDTEIRTIKKEFEKIFNVPFVNLVLDNNGEFLTDDTILYELNTDEYGVLSLNLKSTNPNYNINIEDIYREVLNPPDILTVEVLKEEEGRYMVVVEVEDKTIDKPNLGGYFDTRSGVQYHNGFTQTGPYPGKVPPEMKFHRDTQTVFTRNRKTEREYPRATQMTSTQTWIPNITDRILTPGPYETAEEREKRLDIDGKVRTIQRYLTAWRLRKRLRLLHEEYEKMVKMEAEQEEREQREDDERRKKDLLSKAFPLTSADFSMLYTMLERWKKAEIERITNLYCGPSRTAEFYLLLDKEIEILQSIDRIKQKVSKDVDTQKTVNFFKTIGLPLSWTSNYKNLHIEMDTIETQKGREYFAMYKSVTDKTLNTGQKIQVYSEIKAYLTTRNCKESVELKNLIERFCELLARGMKEKYFEVLEKRIELLLFQLFNDQDCNEGVTNRMIRVKEKLMNKNMSYCVRCQKLKSIEAFTLNARTNKIKICTACKWLDKVEEPWVDLSPYKFILKQIRNYERLHKSESSLVFILSERDICHIIDKIWHLHSALSENTDIYNLRLVRWNRNEEWAPWNCILLTLEESKIHLRIEDLEDVYASEFISHVFNKHALAKKHFKSLLGIKNAFEKNSEEDPRLGGNEEYNPFVAVNSKSKIFFECH